MAAEEANASLDGVILAPGGHPVSNVLVVGGEICCPRSRPEETRTNARGEFRLEKPGKVIHVVIDGNKPDFQSMTVVVNNEAHPLVLTLSPSIPVMSISSCRKPAKDEEMVDDGGQPHFIASTKDVKIKRGVPHVAYVVHIVRPKKGNALMALWFGYATMAFPTDDVFLNSVDFSEVYVYDKDVVVGYDSRGQLRNGKFWRYTNVPNGSAVYEAASGEEARIFDRVIETVCSTPDRKKAKSLQNRTGRAPRPKDGK